MEPCPAAIMRGSTARVRRMTALRLTSKTRCHVASSTSAGGRKASMIPATLARTSTRPSQAATTASTSSRLTRSPGTMVKSRSGKASTSSLSRGSEMSAVMTRAPSWARRTAVARPMPDPAPVTMAVLPANRPAVNGVADMARPLSARTVVRCPTSVYASSPASDRDQRPPVRRCAKTMAVGARPLSDVGSCSCPSAGCSSVRVLGHLSHAPAAGDHGPQEGKMSDETRDVIQRFHDALNSHDLDALGLVVHEEWVFDTTAPPDGTRHVGRDAVLAACQDFFVQSPGARFTMEEIVTVEDRAFVLWRYDWGDGHVRGVDVMRVRDGKVVETLAYVKG